jgi:hypothetical protein
MILFAICDEVLSTLFRHAMPRARQGVSAGHLLLPEQLTSHTGILSDPPGDGPVIVTAC